MVGDTRYAGVHLCSAQGLRVHLLARGRAHQRGSPEKDGSLLPHHHNLVAHGWNVGAARGARPHNHRHLGDAQGRHLGLIVENASEVVAVGKHLGLQRQESAAGIHQVDAGQVVLQGNLLGAKVLLDGYRVVGAALNGGVVGQDHHLFALDYADTSHNAGRRFLAVVHLPCRQRAELEEGRIGVNQTVDPLPGQHLATAAVEVHRPLSAAGPNLGQSLFQVAYQGFHPGLVVQEIPVGGAQVGSDYFHAIVRGYRPGKCS